MTHNLHLRSAGISASFLWVAACSTEATGEKPKARLCSAQFCAEVAFDPGGGAMTSAYSSVYLSTRAGRDKQRGFAGKNMDDLDVYWLDARTLQISSRGGLFTSFTNLWNALPSSAVVGGDVEVLLARSNVR